MSLLGKRWPKPFDGMMSKIVEKHPEVLQHLPHRLGLSFAVVGAEYINPTWHMVIDDAALRDAALIELERLAELGIVRTRCSSPGSKLVVCSLD